MSQYLLQQYELVVQAIMRDQGVSRAQAVNMAARNIGQAIAHPTPPSDINGGNLVSDTRAT